MSDDATLTTAFTRIAPWYRYRPHYPEAVLAHLVERCRLDRTSRVADIGCGPGRIAVPLAAAVAEVIALDPVPAMLYEASRAAVRAGVSHRIVWRLAAAEQIADAVSAPVDLAVIASAIDFIDTSQVLPGLDRALTDEGMIAIIDGGPHLQTERPAWQVAADEVRNRWFGPTPDHARTGSRARPDIEQQCRQAGFGRFERRRFEQVIRRNLDSAVGLQYSYASCNPRALGGHWPTFEAELRSALLAACPDGIFHHLHRTELAITARQPPKATPRERPMS